MKNFNEMMAKRKITGEFTRSEAWKLSTKRENESNETVTIKSNNGNEEMMRSECAKSGAFII